MNLIDKWKNRETKKKLKEENIRLKVQLEMQFKMQSPMFKVARNIQQIKGEFHTTFCGEKYIPVEFREQIAKEQITQDMMRYIEPFIEYDFKSNSAGGMDYIGTLYVATGDRDK